MTYGHRVTAYTALMHMHRAVKKRYRNMTACDMLKRAKSLTADLYVDSEAINLSVKRKRKRESIDKTAQHLQ